MITGYSNNMSVQLLIALLQKHGITRAIISPGTTNLEFAAGLQYSQNFELYSAVDERSAAYMACGMAAESNEPVIITCTEATASRDYFPGITEAYYRKLPILVVTGVHRYYQIGHLQPQIIDRSVSPRDMFKLKVQLPVIKDKEDMRETEFEINKALLALKHRGGGPVHIDLPCCNDEYLFNVTQLPEVRMMQRYCTGNTLPKLKEGKIAIFIGSHCQFSEELTSKIDDFCSLYNAVVFCDHTSGFKGKYAVHAGLLAFQQASYSIFNDIDLLIHLGEATGDGPTMSRLKNVKEVWRISPDGELRDTFGKLSFVFEMEEIQFFDYYCNKKRGNAEGYLNECRALIDHLTVPVEELPFSNVYVAAKTAPYIPEDSFVHIGVSNTIRAWTLFDFPKSVKTASNVGCRGIDGTMSAFVGASFVNRNKLHFCVLGDLSFFYDMNSLGNRHIGNNIRILLINNNGGCVMKLEGAPGHKHFGDAETDKFIAAADHFGCKTGTLAKSYVECLGFDYFAARSKEEFEEVYRGFISNEPHEKPMLLEIFTTDFDDRTAFNLISSIEVSAVGKAKNLAKQVLGNKGTYLAKKLLSGK